MGCLARIPGSFARCPLDVAYRDPAPGAAALDIIEVDAELVGNLVGAVGGIVLLGLSMAAALANLLHLFLGAGAELLDGQLRRLFGPRGVIAREQTGYALETLAGTLAGLPHGLARVGHHLVEVLGCVTGALADALDRVARTLAHALERVLGALADMPDRLTGLAERVLGALADVLDRLADALDQVGVAIDRW